MPAEAGKYVCLIASLLCPHKLRTHFISSRSTRGKHQTSPRGTHAPTQEKESLLLKHSQQWRRERESDTHPRCQRNQIPLNTQALKFLKPTPDHTQVSKCLRRGEVICEEWAYLSSFAYKQINILFFPIVNVFYSCNTILEMLILHHKYLSPSVRGKLRHFYCQTTNIDN